MQVVDDHDVRLAARRLPERVRYALVELEAGGGAPGRTGGYHLAA
jgi:hypothetical protein